MALIRRIALLICLCPLLPAFDNLSQDDVALIQDPGGWEYLSITDADNGFKTTHVCFDGNGRGPCRGTLLFAKDGTFAQEVSVHGQTAHRHGTYEISAAGVVFYDEFETKDGPYTATLDRANSLLTLETVQTGVTIRITLELESEFRKQQADARKQKP
jgi:hypothetical protein